MPAAFLPSPAHGVWNLGPIPVRGYALCVVLGVIVGLGITDRRYRRIGGRPGQILDIATVAVPAGLIGARLYSLIINFARYFGPDRDWVNVLRIWDGGLGLPGAIAGGALGAWVVCRWARIGFRPAVAAAAPALAFAQAVAVCGNWFDQSLYGPPSALPWAVEIAPEYRVNGYESVATFQPVFLYEALWDIAVGIAVIYAIRRLLLTGDRAFALYAGLYAVGRFCTEALSLGGSHRLLGLRADQVLMLVVCAGSIAYLYATRAKGGPDVVAPARLLRPDGGDGGSEAELAAGHPAGGAAGRGATADTGPGAGRPGQADSDAVPRVGVEPTLRGV